MDKSKLPEELNDEITKIFSACYSCHKCSSGCSVAHKMDLPPSIFIKVFQSGEIEKLIKANTIWLCTSCLNCVSRCPFEIDVPRVIDMLKQYSLENKLKVSDKDILLFHQKFLEGVKNNGRINELKLMGEVKLFSGDWFSDIELGIKMFLSRKLTIFGEKIKGIKDMKKVFNKRKNK